MESVKPIKSLKTLSCIAAAASDKLTDEILTQPDYRELIHRTLSDEQQLALFDEYHNYSSDGNLIYRERRYSDEDGQLWKIQWITNPEHGSA